MVDAAVVEDVSVDRTVTTRPLLPFDEALELALALPGEEGEVRRSRSEWISTLTDCSGYSSRAYGVERVLQASVFRCCVLA